MDTSLSLQLQQAWLHAQLSKQSSHPPPTHEPFSPGPWNSPFLAPSFDPASPSLFPHLLDPSPDLPTEHSFSSDLWGSSADWAPSSASAPSNSGASVPGMSSSEDDIFMDTSLEYISELLMDEQMEDRTCMRQECIAFQAIVNGFYSILGEESSSLSSCTERSFSSEGNDPVDDYSWIDDVIVADPTSVQHTAALSASSPWHSGSTGGADLGVKVRPSHSSSASSSFCQDSPAFPADFQDSSSWNGNLLPKASSVPVAAQGSSSADGSFSQESPACPPGLTDTSSWNGDFLPTATSVSVEAQGYTLPSLSNGSTSCVLPASEFPTLHSILYQGDLGFGSSFRPEVASQTLHRNRDDDQKFRTMKSEGSDHNGGQYRIQIKDIVASDSGAYRGAISESSRRPYQGEVDLFRGKDFSHGLSGEVPFPQAQGVAEAHVKSRNRSDDVVTDVNGGGSTALISDGKLSFVKNEYLKAEKLAKMYGEWSPEDLDRKYYCKKMGAHYNGTSGKRADRPDAVDLRGLLVTCAQSVAGNDLRRANEILHEIRQHSSPTGSGTQRLAHYFAEGLVARLSGTGARLYTALSNNRPSAAEMLKAYRLSLDICPYMKLSHYFANQSILKAAEGASRLHIVDYGILYGVQWPSLISALADRKGGPPFLRFTGIEFPQPGLNPAERVEETGRRLAEYARTYNVPFEYKAIASKWEDVEPSTLNLRKGEVLAVNCIFRLRHLLDESVVSASPRRKVLSRMRSMNPDLVVVGVMNAGFNAPFFVSRFREALYHFSSKFDMVDTVGDRDSPLRSMIEKECMGRDILNVVACEGPERVERPETIRQWQSRFQRAGFEFLPLDPAVVSKARAVVKTFYHKDYGVDDDSKWMMLGWKGRIVEGLSAWKPSPGDPNN